MRVSSVNDSVVRSMEVAPDQQEPVPGHVGAKLGPGEPFLLSPIILEFGKSHNPHGEVDT